MSVNNQAPLFKVMPVNEAGRDFCIGDLHGCWSMLQSLLACVGFDPGKDRLFSTGNLIHRGPRSLPCLLLAEEPWFHPVLGRLDDMQMRYYDGRVDWYDCELEDIWLAVADEEFRFYPDSTRLKHILSGLPMAIEVPLRDGRRVGITHSGLDEERSWTDAQALRPSKGVQRYWGRTSLEDQLLWDNTVGNAIALSVAPDALHWLCHENLDNRRNLIAAVRPVPDIDLAISGHVPARHGIPVRCGNRVLLHTGAGRWNGRLSIMELESCCCWTVADPRCDAEPLEPYAGPLLEGDPRRLSWGRDDPSDAGTAR